MTHGGSEDVERSERRACVADSGNQTNQRIEPKAPAEHRHPEQIVQEPSQALSLLIDC